MKNLILAVPAIMISGCAVYEPVPKGYTGDTATISDSYTNLQSTKAHYFVVEEIDDNYITNSWGKTRSDNYGRGMQFTPSVVTRKVIPKRQKFTLQGLVFFPTDAQVLIGDDMEVKSELYFSPEAGKTYTVKGELSKTGSKVWLEDSSGKIIEAKSGSGN